MAVGPSSRVTIAHTRHSLFIYHTFRLCQYVIKDKVWEALSESEARCLMKKAANSGNVGIFHTAKEAVLLKGKVSTVTIWAFEHPEPVDPQQCQDTRTIFT